MTDRNHPTDNQPDHELAGQSSAEKEILARKLGRLINNEQPGPKREAAEQLARHLARDATQSVRQALARELLTCPYLPQDIAKRIADDVDDIASPFLRDAEIDVETMETLARECQERARELLAGRRGVPESVSFAISEIGQEGSVSILMDNPTAEMSERICDAVTNRFEDNPSVMAKIAARKDLPLGSVVKLIKHISDDLAGNLIKGYGLGDDLAHYLAGQVKVGAIGQTMAESDDEQLLEYFKELNEATLLNDGMLLQILEQRQLREFTYALSIRADLTPWETRQIFQTRDRGELSKLLEKANVGTMMINVLRAQYETAVAGN